MEKGSNTEPVLDAEELPKGSVDNKVTVNGVEYNDKIIEYIDVNGTEMEVPVYYKG
ncbi:MAG: hypothetical protein LBD75_02330 [Candidatus Peribacteria bacterium]|nr:hypothetical protein [Candidatus Peribacteria bacterium]